MNEKVKFMVEEYQCPGCVCGSGVECYESNGDITCTKHVAGTTISGIGRILLGMPKGFNRIGEAIQFNLFESFEKGWGYNFLNIPVWKYLDANGNTLVRGISPRINSTFVHVYLGNCIDMVDCYEVTENDISEMD